MSSTNERGSYTSPYPLIPIPPTELEAHNTTTFNTTDGAQIAQWISIEMVIIHNTIIRNLNSIWANAILVARPSAKSGDGAENLDLDLQAFIGFALTWIKMVQNHNKAEEEFMFPVLAQRGGSDGPSMQRQQEMEVNVDQHHVFEVGLAKLEAYLVSVQSPSTGTTRFEGEKVKEIIGEFGDALVQHLHDEIPTLVPEKLSKVPPEDLVKMLQDLITHIKETGGGWTTSMPLVLFAHDLREGANWPPMPGALRWFVLNVLSWWNWRYWKFAPFSASGQPQVYTPPFDKSE